MKKYGTFAGVYTPSLLTILGVIMYMRMGPVVGNTSSIWMLLGIILFAHVISITTGLSVSSVATDKKIKAGGIYYMLSRSLGFPIGGAIGVALFVATALSISLYIIGFGESLLGVFGVEDPSINLLRLVGGGTLLVVIGLAFLSTSLAMKAQFFIMAVIGASLISIFFGSGEGLQPWENNSIENANFSVLFGIFFPAVTGFTAGVAMSGDLKNPTKSIPWGTLLAIGTGLVIYLSLGLLLYYSVDHEVLRTNKKAIIEFAVVGFLVIGGIWGATLSSALGGILGAPRILQAMSNDKITPAVFGKGIGENNEPRNALIFTGVIAFAGIMIGELNQIAEIVAMLYMTAYFFINATCFLEQWASPDFRPTFRIPLLVSLVGALATIILMIQLNVLAAIAALVIVALVFFWLAKKQLEVGSGDVWNSVWFSIVKMGLKNLQKKSTHKRNWEPNILLFSGNSTRRQELIAFSKGIAGQNGMISNFDLIKNESASVLFPKHQQTKVEVDAEDDAIFYRQQECQNIYRGIENIANTYGFSGIDPNTVLMGWGRNTDHPEEFAKMSDYLNQLDHNLLFLDYDEQKGFGARKTLDIWWTNLEEYCELSLHLSKLMLSSSDWAQLQVRVFYNNQDNSTYDYLERIIESKCDNNRVNAQVVIVNNEIEKKPLYELVRKYSLESDLIFLELPKIEAGSEGQFVGSTNDLLREIGTTVLIRASSHFYEDINLDPSLQKEYHEIKSQILLDKEAVDFMAKPSLFPEVNLALETFANQLYDEHFQFAEGVYRSFDETYTAFVGILDEIVVQEDAEPKLIAAFEDFKNHRLSHLKASMQNGLKDLLLKAQDSTADISEVITLQWSKEQLQILGSDPKEVIKAKQKLLKRNGVIGFLMRKVIAHHMEEYYLKDFKKMLHITGLSGFVVNDVLTRTINAGTVNIEEVRNVLQDKVKREHQIFLKYSKSYIQKFIQKIIDDAENPNIELLVLQREEERDASSVKRYLFTLSKFPGVFLYNQQLLTNQLEGLYFLKKLQTTLVKKVTGAKSHLLTQLDEESVLLMDKVMAWRNLSREAYLNVSLDMPSTSALQSLLTRVNVLISEEMQRFKEEVEVISSKSLNDFEKNQEAVAVIDVAFRKTVSFALDKDVIHALAQRINEWQYQLNASLDDVNKSLRLLQFQFGNVSIKEQDIEEVNGQIDQKIEVLQQQYLKVKEEIAVEIESLLNKLPKVLDIDALLNKSDYSQSLYFKQKALSSGAKYLKKTQTGLRSLDRKIDDIVIKLRDTVSKSTFEYRTKGLVNLQSKLADFVDDVSLDAKCSSDIPYYYQQLFTSRQLAPSKGLEERSLELREAVKALERWKSGVSGVILFTGEVQAGKTYVKQNFINAFVKGKVLRITKDANHRGEDLESLFSKASGIYSNMETILSSLDPGTVIDIADLENFYRLDHQETTELEELFSWIERFSGRLLFVMDANIHFYNYAKKIINIDDYVLSSVVIRPLSTKAIKEIILSRHQAGGLKFFWDERHENDLKLRQLNKLMTKVTINTEGNIGSALHSWLGAVERTENNVLIMGGFDKEDIDFKLKPEWELVLYQVLLRKNVSEEELIRLFEYGPFNAASEVQNLLRSRVVLKDMFGDVSVNPYLSIYLVKYLRRQQIIL